MQAIAALRWHDSSSARLFCAVVVDHGTVFELGSYIGSVDILYCKTWDMVTKSPDQTDLFVGFGDDVINVCIPVHFFIEN